MTGHRVVVVGAGITGLSTARGILARAPDASVVVLEGEGRAGGNISTERVDGFVVDRGPDSWVAAKPHATALARRLGLDGELIGTIEANRRVYVASRGGLFSLPEGFVLGVPTAIWPIVTTRLFSLRGKLRMGLEPLVPRRPEGAGDESIESFVSRRLGREVASRLVAPLLGGVYGGDAAELSVRATLPQFVQAEAKHGSLVLGVRAQQAAARKAARPGSAFVSLRGGLGGLIDELARGLGDRLSTGARVTSLARLPDGDPRGRYAVDVAGRAPLFADDVVLALPTRAAAPLLAGLEPRASELLGGIAHTSTAVVFLAVPRAAVGRPLDATGYIVPRTLGSPVLAATWVSSKWEGRAPSDAVLLRVFLGGAGRDELVTRDDRALVGLAKEEIASRMGVTADPLWSRVVRFLHASPQPRVGHLDRMAEVGALLARHPGLFAAGSGYDGVGIPDCVRQAEKIAEAIARPPAGSP